jgi:HK97 family phage major capsid protein
MDIEQLKGERDHLLRTNADIAAKAKKEDRSFTDDEKKDIAANMKDADILAKKIEDIRESDLLNAKIAADMAAQSAPEARRAPAMQPTNGAHPDDSPRIEFTRYSKMKAFKREIDAYKSGQWIRANIFGNTSAARWCRDNGLDVETRAHSENVNTTGGALVPNEFAQTIIDLREEYGVFRQNARVVPMSRDTMTMARRTGGLTAYWSAENTAITESTKAWNNVNLVAKKLGVYALIPSELNEDAIINMADDLARESAYAFALKEDQTGFIGDGTSTYNGVLGLTKALESNASLIGNYAAASGHDTFAEVDAADLTGLMGILPAYAQPNAKFYCSQLCYSIVFQRLALTAGGNTIQSVSGAFQPAFMGYPIVVSQVLPATASTINATTMLLFGDLSAAATMGDRREFTFAQSADYKFAEDQIAVKATERIDINVHDFGDTTNAGPIVALIGTS